MIKHFKNIINDNKTIASNFSYLAILEIYILLAPLVTYPYLVKTLGMSLYGWVITGQITASYASILIDFGFSRVSAKYIAEARGNNETLSKVVSSVLSLRFILWIVALIIYIVIILSINSYRQHCLLFLFSYGLTFSSILFPNFYFQGIENMRYITWVNIISRTIFLLFTFIVINEPSDYYLVPVVWSLGYIIGGIYSLYVVFHKHKIRFIIPKFHDLKFNLRETTPIFLSDVMLNIKDKFNYNILGSVLGMNDVVIYDIGTKIVTLLSKPTMIMSTVLFPKMARNPSVRSTKKILVSLFVFSTVIVMLVYLFLPTIVHFFLDEEIDLFPIYIYLIVPILTGMSYYIPSSVFVVFGKNKYVLFSTIFSTITYVLVLSCMWIFGLLNSLMAFILLMVVTILAETVFRLFLSVKIFNEFKYKYE